jgi:murein L,D-transpeptidase YcbB/YkuD
VNLRSLLVPAMLAAALAPAPAHAEPPPPPQAAALTPPAPLAPPLTAQDAKAIQDMLASAPAQGLASVDVSAAVAGVASADPIARQQAEDALSQAAIGFARAEHGLVADPRSIDANFALKAPYDAAADFKAARAGGRIAAWAAAQVRADPDFLALVKVRGQYAAIVKAGGWSALPAGKLLKAGASDPRVPLLRQRLLAEGFDAAPAPVATEPAAQAKDADAAAKEDLFDPNLAAALAAFQAAHGLKADGELTTATTAALNVPAEHRLAAIDANLERARWMPIQPPLNRVEVDTGDPQAALFIGGQPFLAMRAIVGQPTKRTPTFASKVVAIVFNPPWIVPSNIAAAELYPKERRSPGYFARSGFYVAGGQLIQRAGPKAALGYIKFDIPDPFSVYMHDTPSRSLFAKDKRWLSHGCMRLQNPRDLAAALLAPQGWDRPAVDAAIAARATRSYPLKVQTPVFVVYRTVVTDGAGHAVFRPDVYGWDAKLGAALPPS